MYGEFCKHTCYVTEVCRSEFSTRKVDFQGNKTLPEWTVEGNVGGNEGGNDGGNVGGNKEKSCLKCDGGDGRKRTVKKLI